MFKILVLYGHVSLNDITYPTHCFLSACLAEPGTSVKAGEGKVRMRLMGIWKCTQGN